MGELLQHEILTSLKSTEDEWLINLLEAFNCGDINTFKQTQAKWSQQPDLKVTYQISGAQTKLYSESLKIIDRENVSHVFDGNDIC